MNRYLLAGSAAVALVLGSAAAHADTKFEVRISGDAYFEAGFVDQDNDEGLRSTEFQNRVRVNIIPKATTDSGLEYGARIRLRAGTSNTTTTGDRAFIFLQGGFGRVEAGVTNSFNDNQYISAPTDYTPLGLVDRPASWIGGATQTATGFRGADIAGGVGGALGGLTWPTLVPEGNASKIAYYSPRFGGLQLGASYTPRSDSFNQDVNRVKATSASGAAVTNNFQDLVEIGAQYKGEFGGVSLAASAGYFWGDASKSGSATDNYKDLNAWQVGAQVGYAGFSVGGSYLTYGKSGQNRGAGRFNDDFSNWTVGGQYKAGPLVVGVNYRQAEDPGSLAVRGKRKVEFYEIGAGYTVAPGLTFQAQYDYYEADSDLRHPVTGVSADDKGHVFLVRSVLTF